MEDQELLAGLDRIDWASLAHAFGPAVEVPGWLRDLIDPDADRRECALDALSNAIWHQGTVYSASPHVVPFLVRMLRAPETPDRRLPVLLLALLADGGASMEPFTGDGPLDRRFRAWLAENGRDFEAELAQGRRAAEETRLAVGAAVDDLVPWLGDAEPGVREVVARALGRYPERAVDLGPALRRALAREQDPDLRAAFEEALRALEAPSELGGACDPAP
ncbi:MAG: HEAT repeat domain-containing protein [Anaerolineae bacterium]|nr:HEAT repeat domain-containing protein [Anaerolineae bacterium]